MDILRQRKIETVIKREIVHASLISAVIVSPVIEDG